MSEQLTLENLLLAVGIEPTEVESWRHGDVTHSGTNGANPEARHLPPPPQHIAQLEICVRLLPPAEVATSNESSEPEIPLAKWLDLEARWKAILALEVTMDTLRINMESLLAELESSLNKTLLPEEKNHAPRADIAQWNKSKNRVRNAVPKLKDYIHRAVWAGGGPERKRLEELYKDHIQPRIPFPDMDKVQKQFEDLQKDRQILCAHGQKVAQETKSISANVQGVLRTLQNNAATNAQRKRGGS